MKQMFNKHYLKVLLLIIITLCVLLPHSYSQCDLTSNISVTGIDRICPGETKTLTANVSGASTDCCPKEPLTGGCWKDASSTPTITCDTTKYRAVYKLNMKPQPDPGYTSYCGGQYTNSFLTKWSGSKEIEGYFYERHDKTGFIKAEFTYNQDTFLLYLNYTASKPGAYNICNKSEFLNGVVSFTKYSGFYVNCRTGEEKSITFNGEPVYTSYDGTRDILIIFGWYLGFGGTAWYFEKLPNGVSNLAHCECKGGEKNTYKWSTGDTTKVINVNTAGRYSVTVTDCENCEISSSVEIQECNAKIGNKVFFDKNGNGVLNSSEAGVADVTLNLLSVGADSIANTTDDIIIKTTKSDSLGNYLFNNVESGSYYIQVVPSSLPTDKIFTTKDVLNNELDEFDSDVDEHGRTEKFFVKDKVDNLTIDVGIKDKPKVASVGNLVWNDIDNDGIKDANESGIKGVLVKLRRPNNEIVKLLETDANGNYKFDNLEPDTYKIMFVIPSGIGNYKPSKQTGFGDDNVDNNNDLNSSSHTTALFVLESGENNHTIDAAFVDVPLRDISIADIRVSEGDGNATVQICIDQVSTHPVTVEYSTSDKSAKKGLDYTSVSDTIVIQVGQTCVTTP
jgi:hypothetical protein